MIIMCEKKVPTQRQCVVCNKQLFGRSDKRFCDIQCKNYYHAQVRKSVKTISSETIKILAKNSVILEGIMGQEKDSCVIDQLALERLGFRFGYITNATDNYGILRYEVFAFSYRFVRNRRVEITVDRKRSEISPFIFKRWSREIAETAPLE